MMIMRLGLRLGLITIERIVVFVQQQDCAKD